MNKFGVYGSWRTRLTDALTAEAGARWDSYEYPDDLKFDVVSPRFNLVYEFGEANELRAAWGVVYQPQAVNELQVEDNVTEFFEPERSEQLVIGYARHFARGISLRVDVYDKDYSHLRPRFENLLDPTAAHSRRQLGSYSHRCIRSARARCRAHAATRGRARIVGMGEPCRSPKPRKTCEGDWQSRSWEQRADPVLRQQLDRCEMEREPGRSLSQRHTHDVHRHRDHAAAGRRHGRARRGGAAQCGAFVRVHTPRPARESRRAASRTASCRSTWK